MLELLKGDPDMKFCEACDAVIEAAIEGVEVCLP